MDRSGRDLEFRRRARLADIRQKLSAPVGAILGYQEIIIEEAERIGLEGARADLDRVLAAARNLSALIDRLLEFGSAPHAEAESGMGDIEMRLRHDLRTPLNAIIGYSEIVIEDLSGSAADLLKPDLEKLLGEARRLLGLVDVIIDFSQRELERPDQDGDGPGDPAIAELQRTIRPDGGAAQGHEPGRILVVDDNESNRELLRRRLMHEGHDVAVAESGRRALDMLAGGAFDIVLIDLMMPDMNGLELLHRLRRSEEHTSALQSLMRHSYDVFCLKH